MIVFSRMHQLRTLWMAWWLVLALVVAPALGRMHKVLHAPDLPQAHALQGHDHGPDWLGDHSLLECLVFDQLCLGDDLQMAHGWMAHALPHTAPGWIAHAAAWPAAWPLFEARAPPHVTA